MFTIRNILPDNREEIVQVRRVTFEPDQKSQRAEDYIPPSVWGELENGENVPFGRGTIYVMNDSGKTVAHYELGNHDVPVAVPFGKVA